MGFHHLRITRRLIITQHKHLKQLVRARMAKTGESYATARRQVIAQAPQPEKSTPHLPGNNSGTTALRVLLHAAEVRAPHNSQPYSEALLYGLAGGIGMGVFSFVYEKADFASFFIGGRHLWHDTVAYLSNAAKRLGAEVIVKESSGAKPGEKQLRELLDEYGVCVAWVDAAGLPHRALPKDMEGGAYHVITVYSIGERTATIGDLTDEPIEISLAELAAARARIKKDKHRLLALRAGKKMPALPKLVAQGLQASHRGLLGEGAPKQARRNFSLDALQTWAQRLSDSKGSDSWERVFTPGHRLWRGLTSVYEFIEHYGTGGGLGRPLFAEFLQEAGASTGHKELLTLADRYAQIGAQWSELARAALPDDVPLLAEARELYVQKAELAASGGADAASDVRAIWQRIYALEDQAKAQFPLSGTGYAALRQQMAERVQALYEAEVAVHSAMEELATVKA